MSLTGLQHGKLPLRAELAVERNRLEPLDAASRIRRQFPEENRAERLRTRDVALSPSARNQSTGQILASARAGNSGECPHGLDHTDTSTEPTMMGCHVKQARYQALGQ